MSAFFNTLHDVYLEIPPPAQQAAWLHAQTATQPIAQWQLYLNHLCLQLVLPWIQADHDPTATAGWSADELTSIGQLVPGVPINLGSQRLIVIADRTIDSRELRVPQEWIDIPDWAGSYYLAVQVNLDDGWLRIWSYTTHAHLKTQGEYDAVDRTYCLDAAELVPDLNALWVTRQLNPNEATQAALAPLPSLTPMQAHWQFPAAEALGIPRLSPPFVTWSALVTDPDWRRSFLNPLPEVAPELAPARSIVQLRDWLQQQFDGAWDAVDRWLTPAEFAMVRQPTEQETCTRIKAVQLADTPLLLLLAITPEPDEKIRIQAQLRPTPPALTLPAELTLTLLSTSHEPIQTLQTRDHDNAIQLKRFRCPAGTEFLIQISIAQTSHTERFLV